MIRLISSLTIAFVIINGCFCDHQRIQAMANWENFQVVDEIYGSSFPAIQSAMEIFGRHRPDMARSVIEVPGEGNSVFVFLTDKDDPADTRKTLGVKTGSEKELSAWEIGYIMERKNLLRLLDRMRGSSFLPIRKSLEIFRQRYRKLDLAEYRIEVYSVTGSVYVIFIDKNRPADAFCCDKHRGFEVELNAEDLTVIKSHFLR